MKIHGMLTGTPAVVAFLLLLQACAPAGNDNDTAQGVDFSGVWLLQGGGGDSNTGNVAKDGTVIASAFQAHPQSQWSSEQLPFTTEGLEQFNANKPGKGPRLVRSVLGNDPIGEANPAGLYRALAYSRPIEIVQVPGKIVQLFGLGRIFRIIYLDGRPVPDEILEGPFWYGYSVGHWEGDTLVVNTLGLDGRAWIDEWGTPISDDARVEERWQRLDENHLQLAITINDPVLYSHPWTSDPIVYTLRNDVEPNEVIAAPIDEKAFNAEIRDAQWKDQ